MRTLIVLSLCLSLASSQILNAGLWTMLDPGMQPTPRSWAGNAIAGPFLFTVGGSAPDLNDAWAYNANKNTWTQLPAVTPVQGLHATSGDIVGGKLWIFGGKNEGGTQGVWHDSLLSLDISNDDGWLPTGTWTVVTQGQTDGIAARNGHTVTAAMGNLYVFAGWNNTEGHGDPSAYFNDLWVFSTNSGKWKQLNPSGTLPLARDGHSTVAYDGKLIVFGGWGKHDAYLNDMWAYDIVGNAWMMMQGDGAVVGPSPRYGQGATVYGDNMIIWGGTANDNELYSYNFGSSTWTTISTPNGYKPPGFNTAYPAFGLVGGRLILFGGNNGGNTWAFNFIPSSAVPMPQDCPKPKCDGGCDKIYGAGNLLSMACVDRPSRLGHSGHHHHCRRGWCSLHPQPSPGRRQA